MLRSVLILDPPGGADLSELAEAFRSHLGPDSAVHRVGSLEEAVSSLGSDLSYQLVVLERGQENANMERPVRRLREARRELPILAVAHQGDVESTREAIQAGATDFLVLGDHLSARVETALQKMRPLLDLIEHAEDLEAENRRHQLQESSRHSIVGRSPQMLEVLEQLERVATIPRPVLIVGERGTGKELVARALHAASDTRDGPMIAVNCASFPDALLESELFGHEKGAFTGADAQARGKFELAAGGTLFLDEIGFMSMTFQQKILRAVEYGLFTRVGGREEMQTDARVVAATNVDLEKKMSDGTFLRDLYDRLAFEVIRVPPLRHRAGDVEVLAQHFLSSFMREIPALRGKALSAAAIAALRTAHFPGNVRELKNVIERAAYRDTTNEITPSDIGLSPARTGERRADDDSAPFNERVEAFRAELITGALEQANGNQSKAARILDMPYHRFRYFYSKYRD